MLSKLLFAGGVAAGAAIWRWVTRDRTTSEERVAGMLHGLMDSYDTKGPDAELKDISLRVWLDMESAGRTLMCPRLSIEAAQHVRATMPRMARTAANRLVAETAVLKYLSKTSCRNVDKIHIVPMAVELCFIRTAADVNAEKIARALRGIAGTHGAEAVV